MIRFVGYFEDIELMGLAGRVEINVRGETRVMATYKQKGKSSICYVAMWLTFGKNIEFYSVTCDE